MRLRMTFLTKFTLATFGVLVIVTIFLAYVLERAHLEAVERNEGTNAVAQVSLLFSKPVAEFEAHPSLATRAELMRAGATTNVLDSVTAVRVYRPDGRPLYPATAPPASANVKRTLELGEVWSAQSADPAGQTITTYYSPLAALKGNEYAAVVAVDIDHALLETQAQQERRVTIIATATAVILVFVALVTLAAGASRELERRRREAETTFVQTLGVLADIVDRRDPYTANHSKRVAAYSKMLAIAMRLDAREVAVIESSALLHDLGKIGIPDAVLLKPARLSVEERQVIKHHPVIGAEILASISSMEDVVPCVLHHHERFDGDGYPKGLRGTAIPLGSRIIAVADTFDAMTTDRPYRRALAPEVALEEITRVVGSQLDADCVEEFAVLVRSGRVVPPPPAQTEEELEASFGPQRYIEREAHEASAT